MKKGLLIAVVVALVLAMAVPAALALTDAQKTELEQLYEQRHQLSQQILDKQVEAGLVTEEDAQAIRERMTQGWEFRKQQMSEGNYNFGPGRRGRGGFGGYGRRGGGCGNCPVQNQETNTLPQDTSSTL